MNSSSEPEEDQPEKKPTFATNKEENEKPDHQDFISALPDDILHIILSKLPIPDAAVTTAISKRWAPLFPTLSSLHFDKSFLDELYAEDHHTSWFQALFSVLDSRKGPIKKFVLSPRGAIDYEHYYDKIFNDVCASGVEELSIGAKCIYNNYRIPLSVFACDTITKLEISYCRLVVPSKLTGLRSLKSLMLTIVQVADDDLQRMISQCKAMEKLVIAYCSKFKNIVICAPSLSELVIELYCPVGIVLKSVPRLASITVSFAYNFYRILETYEAANFISFLNALCSVKDLWLDFNRSRKILSKKGMALPTRPPKFCLVELKKLCLYLPMNLHGSNMIVSRLLNISPHLMEIIISDAEIFPVYKCPMYLDLNFWEKQLPAECVKHHLMTATFYLGHISKDCLVFPKFLLLNAGNLKRLNLLFYKREQEPTSKTVEEIENELLAMQMASPDVEIMIKPTKIIPKYSSIYF